MSEFNPLFKTPFTTASPLPMTDVVAAFLELSRARRERSGSSFSGIVEMENLEDECYAALLRRITREVHPAAAIYHADESGKVTTEHGSILIKGAGTALTAEEWEELARAASGGRSDMPPAKEGVDE